MYEVDKEVIDYKLLKLNGKVKNNAQAGATVKEHKNGTERVLDKKGTALQFNGKESYFLTDIKSPGFNWTTAMWINPETDGNGILMEGKTRTLRLEDGKLKYQIEGYTHTFDCAIPSGEWTHITLTGTFEGVALYIDGQKFDTLIPILECSKWL